jgi:hypothetical protein
MVKTNSFSCRYLAHSISPVQPLTTAGSSRDAAEADKSAVSHGDGATLLSPLFISYLQLRLVCATQRLHGEGACETDLARDDVTCGKQFLVLSAPASTEETDGAGASTNPRH